MQHQLQELIESMRDVRVDFVSVFFTSIDYIALRAILTISLKRVRISLIVASMRGHSITSEVKVQL